MRNFFQKSIISIIGLSIALNPLVVLVPQNVRAATDQTDSEGGSVERDGPPLVQIDRSKQENAGYSPATPTDGKTCSAYSSAHSQAYNSLAALLIRYANNQKGLTFTDIFSDQNNPKIVMTSSDRKAVKALSCLTKVMPNYNEDLTALFKKLSSAEQTAISNKVGQEMGSQNARYKTTEQYFNFLRYGTANQNTTEYQNNLAEFNGYITEAEKSFTSNDLSNLWGEQVNKILNHQPTTLDASTIDCVTRGLVSANTLTGYTLSSDKSAEYVAGLIQESLDSLVIDFRIVNTLIYLVTPKDQGGAGHWRIRVARLLQKTDSSTESDATVQNNNNASQPTLVAADANNSAGTTPCDATMTAAECGSQQNHSNVEVQDQDGTQYDAFFQNMDREYDDQANVSAHKTGQAIDISEVDDLRCTIVKKRYATLLGLGKDTKEKQPIRPIKLAWQTTDGYAASGGNPIDQMGMMKDLAKQSIIDLLSSMNSNITEYDGDLTKASFTDLVGILGQSLLAGVITSPGHNLKGYSVTDTAKNLGMMYFADYFSLPKEIFKGADITDLENLKYVIGRSAVEKNLGLPYGSLDNLDLKATNLTAIAHPTYDLSGLLVNIGQRKVEHEMGLESHDMDRFFKLGKKVGNEYLMDYTALGRVVIEDDLNLTKNSWPVTTTKFSDLKNSISDARVAILRIDPGYIDSILHVDAGTTQSFIRETINSEQFAEKVGTSRYNDTTAGLKYFAMNNAAYHLPGPTKDNPNAFDTWAEALKGNLDALKTIGIYTLSRLLGENSLDMDPSLLPDSKATIVSGKVEADGTVTGTTISSADGTEEDVPYDRTTYGQFVFREWLRANLGPTRINPIDGCGKPGRDSTAINLVYSGQQVYKGPADLNNPTATDAENTTTSVCQPFIEIKINNFVYSDATGTHTYTDSFFPPNIGRLTAFEEISDKSAISAGLEHSDLVSIMGYGQADGRSVFERIGGKMLYYGIANKALSPEEKAAIDLSNTNPSLIVTSSSNKTVVFYLSRIVTIQNLIPKIKGEWEAIADNSPEAKDITQRIKNITNAINSIKENNGLDLTKIHNIANVVSKVTPEIMAIKNNLKILRDRYSSQTGDEAVKKINQINALIYDVNAFILAASEIMAGHKIDSTDALTIDQLKQATNKNTANRQNKKGLSDWQIMLLVYEMLSNKISPQDFALRLGANTAEAKLDLPQNSILYLAQNYEKYGITGIDTFYDSLGQAQIEQEFSMPTYYFQGNTVRTNMPGFDKMDTSGHFADLRAWALDKDGKSIIQPVYELDRNYFNNTIDAMNVAIQASGTGGELIKINYPDIDTWILYTRMMHGKGTANNFDNWVKAAQKKWLAYPSHKTKYYDKTIDNVVANISSRGFAGGIQSAQNDLLMRLGFPTGIYDGMVQDKPAAWGLANSRAQAIDKALKLPTGYTRMLFTRDKSITSKSISQKDKNAIQASDLKISQNEIEKYIQMLNGALLPSEAEQYGTQTDYVVNNPYADPGITGATCPVTYTAQNGFMVNETNVPSDSFIYYDKKGRHAFQSADEASRFANDHKDDQITNIVDDISSKLTEALNPTVGSQIFPNGSSFSVTVDEISTGIKNFISDKNAVTIFSDQILNKLSAKINNEPKDNLIDSDRIAITKAAFGRITTAKNDPSSDTAKYPNIPTVNVPVETLMNIFTRTMVDSPLSQYKIKVGTWVAQEVLVSNIFDQINSNLGLDLDPTLFDGADFYDILTGDYSSLYRLGGTLVDRAMDLKPGTTQLIIAAVSPQGRKCALNSAGGGLLGSAFGLTNFPINRLNLNVDDFMSILGEEKIEETLNLPRGTFRVERKNDPTDKLNNLVTNVGIINFFVAFKLPIDLTTREYRLAFANGVKMILGDERYNSIKNASPQYQLAQVKTFLSSALVIKQDSGFGVEDLEHFLHTILDSLTAALNSTDYTVTPLSVTSSMPIDDIGDADTSNAYADYKQQVKNFYNQMNYTDNSLGLNKYSTYYLLSGRTKPSAYINSVGDALGLRIGGLQLAQLLGLDLNESQAAVELALNIQKIFSCEANPGMSVQGGTCQTGLRPNTGALIGSPVIGGGLLAVSNNKSDWYHRWDRLYADLDKVFHLKLDRHTGLPNGTIQSILDNPNNTFPILIGIGAQKLDAKFKIKSKNDDDGSVRIASFTGLYQAMLPADRTTIETTCHDLIFPGATLDILEAQIAGALDDLKKATTPDDREAKRIALLALQIQYYNLSAEEQSCIMQKKDELAKTGAGTGISRRDLDTYLGRAWEWVQAAAAETLHNQLLDFKAVPPGCTSTRYRRCQPENVGIDMPTADIRAMFNGDLRYMEAAGMAMGANLVLVEVNNIQINNCNPAENQGYGCNAPVPAGMRISYAEIKLALFGLSKGELIQLAAWNDATGGSYKPDPDKGSSFSNVNCGSLGNVSDIATCMANSGRVNDATKTVPAEINYQYGFNPTNLAAATTATQAEMKPYYDRYASTCAGSDRDSCILQQEELRFQNDANTTCESSSEEDRPACIEQSVANMRAERGSFATLQGKLGLISNPQQYSQYINLRNNPTVKEIQESAKKAAQDKLKYDMMDIALWKIDENIPAGFSRIMIAGNTSERWSMLAMYVHNGLINGHLFGINFKSIDANLVNAGASSIAILAATNKTQRENAYNSLGTTGFGVLTDWISEHSKNYLGFKLDKDMTSGLLVSIFTGDWGADAFSLDDVFGLNNAGKASFIGGKQFTTLGGAVVNFGLNKIFAWADRALGLKPGQGAQLFVAAKNIYTAVVGLATAKAGLAAAISHANEVSLTGTAAEKTAAQGAVDTAYKKIDASHANISAAAGVLVQLAISILVDKILGKTLGGIEDQLGLVPGTLAPLISAGIYVGVVAAVNAGFFGSAAVGFLPALGPWGLAAIAAMFVIQTVFGVHEVDYYCNADGYFPRIGTPDPSKNDVSDLGEVGGKVGGNLNKAIETFSIQAAQYKARRLIGDTMEEQYSSDFNDANGLPTIPVQIMTGRAEDVDYWKESVLNNICKQRLGNDAQLLFNGQAAVCDAGLRRMGLWQNPQTVAWTHVGF